jgi:hypothetical protein
LAALIVATVPVWMVLIDAAVTKTRITATMMLPLALGTCVMTPAPGTGQTPIAGSAGNRHYH